MNGQLSIGNLARAAEVNVETIRYYQRRGLLDEPAKPLGGHRRYAVSAAARVRFIKRAQLHGFTLEEIRELADGRVYTASQALKLKLIDEVGYFDEALTRVLSLAKIPSARVVSYSYYPKRQSNLYASKPETPSLFEGKSVADALPKLQSGFYYLWLPQAKND